MASTHAPARLPRVHEFDPCEVSPLVPPAPAQAMHGGILTRAVGTLKALGLTTRVLEICTGDLGQSHARQFDVEIYAPGVDRWLEASSCSWFSDYQARRANIRYKPADGGSPVFAHTLNGSALAVPRVLAVLLEQYRNADGSVTIPDALLPYCRGATAISLR